MNENVPMIEVERLNKIYGETYAIRDLSFSVNAGEVVGYLGPNGSGKTTTMKILACYMPASTGRASVAGLDTYEQSDRVREVIGYLPEDVPLYPDMRVRGFLEYAARLRGIEKARIDYVVNEAMELVDIRDRDRDLIAGLSKGYRQRVGLATAIMHKPRVIFLDEPTVGLDPTQVIEFRNLVKNLSAGRTIMLNTHILPEVEQICTRVIIIYRGEIVREGRIDELLRRHKSVFEIRSESPSEKIKAALECFAGLEYLDPRDAVGYETLLVRPSDIDGFERGAVRKIVAAGLSVTGFTRRDPTLEELFVDVVGAEKSKKLADGNGR